MKVVTAKRNEPRCSICKSGRRESLDAYLQLYLNDEPDDGGAKLTWPRLREIAGILTGSPLTERSIRRHLTGHCEVSSEERADVLNAQSEKGDEERDELLDELDKLLETDGFISPVGVLNVQLRSWLLDTRRRIAAGERIQLTADQAQRAAAQLVAAEKKGQEAVILSALTGGILDALNRSDDFKQLPPADEIVLEAEDVKVEEDAA